jgi:hypothetical protein
MAGRHFELYFSWSRPAEVNAELGILENRYPTLFELRRATWPEFESLKDTTVHNQSLTGFLDDIVLRDFKRFRDVVQAITGNAVGLTERVADDGSLRYLDDKLLGKTDTLILVSLDHIRTGQRPTAEEVGSVSKFLQRDKSCLLICPHHDVGENAEFELREREFKHHGDPLVPEQQRIGGFARQLLQALGLPIENRYGLRPARSTRDLSPAPLHVFSDAQTPGILENVRTFNLHPHLPHLQLIGPSTDTIIVMAKQSVDLSAPSHPFVEAGNTVFNAMLWVRPAGQRAGNIFVCDATLWSSAFSGIESLEQFWRNLANMS